MPSISKHIYTLHYWPKKQTYEAGCRGPWPAWRAYGHWQERQRAKNERGRPAVSIRERGARFSKAIKQNELKLHGRGAWRVTRVKAGLWQAQHRVKRFFVDLEESNKPFALLIGMLLGLAGMLLGFGVVALYSVANEAEGSCGGDCFIYAEAAAAHQAGMTETVEYSASDGAGYTYQDGVEVDLPDTVGQAALGIGWKALYTEVQYTGVGGDGFATISAGVRWEGRF